MTRAEHILLAALLAGGIVALGRCVAPAKSNEIVGRVTVIDGDTLESSDGTRIRLHGVDAFETGQTCGSWACGRIAANRLDEWLAETGSNVQCIAASKNVDRYGRTVARCARYDGEDLGNWLVAHGYALDWPRYSHGEYAAAQLRAEKNKLGVWTVSDFWDTPWDWRKKK